jgi:antitoxin CptB
VKPPPSVGEGRDIQRLKWRSRRGLLELDLVFDRFWAGPGARMTEEEAAALEKLLLLPDNDLLDLVMGRTAPPGGDLGDMVQKLRAA